MATNTGIWPGAEATRVLTRSPDGPPVYAYDPVPGVPPVSVIRVGSGSMASTEAGHAHVHDFLLIAYFQRGGGSLRLGNRQWPVQAGDLYLVAPGEVIGVGDDRTGLTDAEGWGVFFPPEGLGATAPDALLSWRAHPLLFPFARGVATGAQRLAVPARERSTWTRRLSDLDLELRQRRDGYHEAVVAHLTLLLVEISRLAADTADDLKLHNDPVLNSVFIVIEQRYHEPLSLKHVAAALNLTPGYLTTLVRRRTGRTVQEWITERRMAQARRLLAETDLSVADIATRIGYADPGYFVRTFRRTHATTPLRWRQAGRH